MKFMNTARKYGARVALAGAALVGSAGAFAAAADAATAITAVSSDVSTIGWAALGVLIVAAGFKYMRRAV